MLLQSLQTGSVAGWFAAQDLPHRGPAFRITLGIAELVPKHPEGEGLPVDDSQRLCEFRWAEALPAIPVGDVHQTATEQLQQRRMPLGIVSPDVV